MHMYMYMYCTKPPFYQLKAFIKGNKPGIYEVVLGDFVRGTLEITPTESHRSLLWKRYYRLFRKILKQYPYIHSAQTLNDESIHAFYIFRENNLQITPKHLQSIQNHHREIGLAIGIPQFAVDDFTTRPKNQPLCHVKIPRLGLIFTMSKTARNLALLEEFLATKGLKRKQASIK